MQILSRHDSSAHRLPLTAESHPQAWMLRRLRTTLGIAVLMMIVQTVSFVSEKQTRVTASAITTRHEVQAAQRAVTPSAPRAVLPAGWRRTASGWQHVSTWKQLPVESISLTQRVLAQRDAEPLWLRRTTAMLRRTPPGCFALAQLLAVGLLFVFFRGPVTKRVTGRGDSIPVSPTWLSR